MRAELLYQMQKYFQGGDSREHFCNIEKNELFAVALLDHRYKSRGFIQQENVTNAKRLLMTELNTISVTVDMPTAQQASQHSSAILTPGSSSKRSGWDSVLDSSSEDEDGNSIDADLEGQVSAYFTECLPYCLLDFTLRSAYFTLHCGTTPMMECIVQTYFVSSGYLYITALLLFNHCFVISQYMYSDIFSNFFVNL